MYSGGSHCGQTVVITGNGKTISAKVADECPTCASSGSLDLSYGAFTALASTDAGVVSITWHFA
jgi:expansin (peptidoglycan-binding protein)